MSASTLHVTVCILTCGRPAGLHRLLESITALRPPEDPVALGIVVVDNDPNGESEDVCGMFSDTLRIVHSVEPRRGIPFARNTAIHLAGGRTDFIAFVDDDETLDPDWLASLLRTQRTTGADIVTGPAIPRMDADVPEWLASAFALCRYRTGTDRPFAYTNNVLVRREVFERVTPCFDERMAHCGGSDTHFFRRARLAGHRIVWADDAITYEWIPRERARTAWLLRRSLRIGGTDAFIIRDIDGRRSALLRIPARAARYMARGGFRIGSGLRFGRASVLGGTRDIAHACGLLAGIWGYRHQEYRVHP